MKEYKKPAMMALSISANDLLCGCDVKTRDTNDPFIQNLNKLWGAGGNDDGILDPDDKVFGSIEEQCDEDRILEGYCKFGVEGMQLFTS